MTRRCYNARTGARETGCRRTSDRLSLHALALNRQVLGRPPYLPVQPAMLVRIGSGHSGVKRTCKLGKGALKRLETENARLKKLPSAKRAWSQLARTSSRPVSTSLHWTLILRSVAASWIVSSVAVRLWAAPASREDCKVIFVRAPV